jgi:hypothetical protein
MEHNANHIILPYCHLLVSCSLVDRCGSLGDVSHIFIYYLTNSIAYGTRRFNAAFNNPYPEPTNPITRIDTYFFNIHSNIVLLTMPRPF